MSLNQKLRGIARELPGIGLLRAMRRRGNVVMFHSGRVGSTVVGELLRQSPKIFWDREIYDRLFADHEKKYGGIQRIGEVDPLVYLKQRASAVGAAYYGFEVAFRHLVVFGLDLPTYVEAVAAQGCQHFIVLERKNKLRSVISALVAKETAEYHVLSGKKPPRKSVTVDVERISMQRRNDWILPLVEVIDTFEHNYAEARRVLDGKQALFLTYEDDVLEDPRRAYQQACDFLGVAAPAAEVRLTRTNPYPVRDLIENVADVERVLQGSGYEWMLDE